MKILFVGLFIILSQTSLVSQTVSGIIYDEDEVLVAVKIINKSQNIAVLSSTNGMFSISAKIKDTLSFQSSFHHTQTIVVADLHFNKDLVIELKKIKEELSEVYLENEKIFEFQDKKYSAQLSEQLTNDIKNNPEKYSGVGSGNMDFIAIFGMVAKLFKGKNSKNKELVKHVNAKELKAFFENDKFFNQDFLKKDLNINPEFQELFFDYLETKNISSKLLVEEEQFNLIGLFLDYSKEFNAVILESNNQKN